ncbi:hypothetical protein PRAC110570_04890 [Propionibacterium acidifaciens]
MSDWLRVRAGRWVSLDCGLSCPRQNGKNAILEVYELFVTVGLGRRVLHTAHEVKTGRKHFRRLRYFLGERAADPGAEFQELNKLVREIRNVNGQEGIYLTNGGSIELVARSKSSGRGFTVDTLVCDEAQEPTDDELQAINPSISAAPSGDPLGDIAHILGELLKDPIGYPKRKVGGSTPSGRATRGPRGSARAPRASRSLRCARGRSGSGGDDHRVPSGVVAAGQRVAAAVAGVDDQADHHPHEEAHPCGQ